MDCEDCYGTACSCDLNVIWKELEVQEKKMESFNEEITAFMNGFKEPAYTDILGVRKDLNKLEDYCVEQWKELKKDLDEIRRSQKKE